MKFTVIIHKSKYGYDAQVPALPGCHTQGETEKEVKENVKDAIRAYLAMDAEYYKGGVMKTLEVSVV